MTFLYELSVYVPYYLECFLLTWLMLRNYEKKPCFARNAALMLSLGVVWQAVVSALIYIPTPGYEMIFGMVKFLLCFAPLYFWGFYIASESFRRRISLCCPSYCSGGRACLPISW